MTASTTWLLTPSGHRHRTGIGRYASSSAMIAGWPASRHSRSLDAGGCLEMG